MYLEFVLRNRERSVSAKLSDNYTAADFINLCAEVGKSVIWQYGKYCINMREVIAIEWITD